MKRSLKKLLVVEGAIEESFAGGHQLRPLLPGARQGGPRLRKGNHAAQRFV